MLDKHNIINKYSQNELYRQISTTVTYVAKIVTSEKVGEKLIFQLPSCTTTQQPRKNVARKASKLMEKLSSEGRKNFT